MLVLFIQDFQSSFFSFKREGLDLEGLSIRERMFDLRENLSLASDSSCPYEWLFLPSRSSSFSP